MAEVNDTLLLDSAALSDSLAVDTIEHDTSYVFVLERADIEPLPARHDDSHPGVSWILTGMLLLFALMAIRFSSNSKYLGALLRNAVEVRERGNVFDDTVRETSFVAVLNLLWCVCGGVLLYTFICRQALHPWAWPQAGRGFVLDAAAMGAPYGMAVCSGLVLIYMLFLVLMYTLTGNIFTDGKHTRMWVRGFLSATGLSTPLMFVLALAVICYPAITDGVLIAALVALILCKMVFIWKGFRIFFAQRGSWVLFLYYLCSLEIVPIILLYISAVGVCGILL